MHGVHEGYQEQCCCFKISDFLNSIRAISVDNLPETAMIRFRMMQKEKA